MNPFSDFRREISQQVCTTPDGAISLNSTLRDIYHEIVLKVAVEPASLTITDIEATFTRCPTDTCPLAAERLHALAGARIGKGLGRLLNEQMGRSDGCINLKNMLAALLPLAVNARIAARSGSEAAMMKRLEKQLAGLCAGYPRNMDAVE